MWHPETDDCLLHTKQEAVKSNIWAISKMRSCREMCKTHMIKLCNTQGWRLITTSLPIWEAVNTTWPHKTCHFWSPIYLGSKLICQWTQITWLVLWRKLRHSYPQRRTWAARTNTEMKNVNTYFRCLKCNKSKRQIVTLLTFYNGAVCSFTSTL